MVVDNADDPRVLMVTLAGNAKAARLIDYLPTSHRGAILFTTRSRKAAEGLTHSDILGLGNMNKNEAKQLLAQRITNEALLADEQAVAELLERLAYLPLAIVQAAAFINSKDCSAAEYISLFEKVGIEAGLFSEHFEDSSRYHETESTIAKILHISFDQIRKQNRLAADYLSFMACVDRVRIPESLLSSTGCKLQHTKAIGTLKGYAFITEHQQNTQQSFTEEFFEVHRLVQKETAWWLKENNELAKWEKTALTQILGLLPYGGYDGREIWVNYLIHALHISRVQSEMNEDAKASLLERIGRCHQTLGQYAAADVALREVLLIRTKRLGREHPGTLASVSQLGSVLSNQGKYDEAQAMLRRALEGSEKVLGPEHPHTLDSVYSLAFLFHQQQHFFTSHSLYQRAYEGYVKTLGAHHPTAVACLRHYKSAQKQERLYLGQC